MKRIFWIVLDSAGIGEAPDADKFGDVGSNTWKSCYDSGKLHIPNMEKIGIYQIDGMEYAKSTENPTGSFAKMQELSCGKDTTTGHWEMAGVPVRHITAGRNVPMYDTSIECRSAGAFHSTMVVSMRGIPSTQVADACRISGYYPSVHGAPVCVGDPSAIGIDDIMHPDYGGAPVLEPGDVPVFWACGVTPQAAVMASKPEFAITHAPGHMFITSKRDLEYMV